MSANFRRLLLRANAVFRGYPPMGRVTTVRHGLLFVLQSFAASSAARDVSATPERAFPGG